MEASTTVEIIIGGNDMRLYLSSQLTDDELRKLLAENSDRTDVDPKALTGIRDELVKRAEPPQSEPHYNPTQLRWLARYRKAERQGARSQSPP